MNGAHDLGGMHGFGPVEPERDEPVFHAEWERRCFALVVALGYSGEWNIDMSRSAREQMPPADYLATSYYEHWLFGLQYLLAKRGLLTEAEIENQKTAPRPRAINRFLTADDAVSVLMKGASAERETGPAPRFSPGERVRARVLNPRHHTRLPRYARGRVGTIDRAHGFHVLPDENATGRGEAPQACYSVRFAARELWGPEANARDSVYIDLWDSYLEPA